MKTYDLYLTFMKRMETVECNFFSLNTNKRKRNKGRKIKHVCSNLEKACDRLPRNAISCYWKRKVVLERESEDVGGKLVMEGRRRVRMVEVDILEGRGKVRMVEVDLYWRREGK